MKVYQLYYTSCRKGLTSGMGFQTYSMSQGITEEERQEIEKHCNYVEPSNLPSSPTEQEIKELFPVSFSFFKLKSGKSCICKINYKGRDYSGRFGNYFCHVLIFEEELHFYPIQIYNSKIFKDSLTKEEENAEIIKPLEVLNSMSEEDFINASDIEKFLKGTSVKKRNKSLNDLIDGIIDGKQNDKKVVFSDDSRNLHMWIAAATMVFPVSMANSITFNTYNVDAFSTEEFLCGSLALTKNYKFNMFNFNSDDKSEIDLKSKFAKQAALEYTIIKDYRKDIIEFIELFNYEKIDLNIDNCVNLFSIINNGLQKVKDEDVVNSIAFVNKYGSESALEKIMSTIDTEALNKITTNLNLKMAEVMFKFLFRISKITKKQEYIDKAYSFFFDSIHFMVVDDENVEVQAILRLYEEIRNYNEDNLKSFVSKAACIDRLKNIEVYLEGGTARHAQFYFCSIVGDFMALYKLSNTTITWEYLEKNVYLKKIMVLCIKVSIADKSKFYYVLNYIHENSDYFSNVVNIAFEVCSSGENYTTLISSCSEILSELSFYKASEIIEEILEKKHGGDILIFSFKYKLRGACDKFNYFTNYCTNVFDKNIKYRDKYFYRALEELIHEFESVDFNMSFYESITKYIAERRLEKNLGEKLAEKLVHEFQNIVSIKLLDEAELQVIAEINSIKYLYKMDVNPNISEMLQCVNALYKGKVYVEDFLCSNGIFYFNGISKEKYESILNLMFEIICPKLNDILSHMKMKKLLMYDKYMITYFNIYMKAMNDIFDLKGNNKIYLDFICFMIKSKSLFSENQFKDIEENIIYNIVKVDIAHIESYDKYIERTIENSTIGEETRKSQKVWREIYKRASKEIDGKSIFDKIQQKIYKK